MKLCLGTVQFGSKYGISNTSGQVSYKEIQKILDYCREHDIRTIDTAQAYGESEYLLGQLNLCGFNIITKITQLGKIEDSLERLKISSLYGILLHNENEIDHNWSRLKNYKHQGLVKKIGVSVYSPDTLSNIINKYPIDIVQLPLNILDQRFLFLLPVLKERNIEIYVRSIFLQGLLLMDYSQVPAYFNSIKPILNKIPRDKIGFTLNFIKNINEIDKVVVGVTSKKELEEISLAYHKNTFDYSDFCVNDVAMINPSLWNYK
jgi:aryl-alcohol dehydrogenase-like predicted oxidoreductase